MFRFRAVALAVLICVAPTASLSALARSYYFLPQAAVGTAGNLQFITSVTMRNPGAIDSNVSMEFHNNDGGDWLITFVCNDQTGNIAAGADFTLKAGRKSTFRLGPAGAMAVGWVYVASDCPLQVSATYGYYSLGSTNEPIWEAAVLPSPAALQQSFAAHRRESEAAVGVSSNTGYALANPNSNSVNVTAKLYDSLGVLLDTQTFSLPAKAHRAQFIDELFPEIPANFRGTVWFESVIPLAGLAMKEAKGAAQTVYSTVPMEPDSDFKLNHDYDIEANDPIEKARVITAPTEVYGALHQSQDFYKIHLSALQTLQVILLGEALNSYFDPALQIQNSSGVDVGTVEKIFTAGSYDRSASFVAPQAGDYYIRVTAVQPTVGPNAFYRMFVRTY